MSDPSAPDLGASRARLERACVGNQGWAWVSVDDLLALLRGQEAQAARLANAAEMGKVLDALLADKAAAEQRATRLAALEVAARRWAATAGLPAATEDAEDALLAALAVLDTPPGDLLPRLQPDYGDGGQSRRRPRAGRRPPACYNPDGEDCG